MLKKNLYLQMSKVRKYPEESNESFFRNGSEISLLTTDGIELKDKYPNQPDFTPPTWKSKLISYSG
jgi:hypothetical protein